jgi:hypothetical protein
MARFILTLTDEQRAKVEAHRVRLGARSHADAIRKLIDGDGVALSSMRHPETGRRVMPDRDVRPLAIVDLPRTGEGAPKPAFKSRLKGEWAPPGKKR